MPALTASATMPAAESHVSPMRADKPRILVVDDERLNLKTLHELLRDEYTVMVALSGDQGLRAVVAGQPELILLDIGMPGMDGYDDACARKHGAMPRPSSRSPAGGRTRIAAVRAPPVSTSIW